MQHKTFSLNEQEPGSMPFFLFSLGDLPAVQLVQLSVVHDEIEA